MPSLQVYLARGIPISADAALLGLLLAYIDARFDAVDRRFDDMRDLWRAELRRVAEVLDATL